MSKVIVITGATKGIGKAIAEKFAVQGFQLALCARNINDSIGWVRGLKTPALFLPCDVSNKKQVQYFAEEVLNKYGSIDVLVNNAGVFLPGAVHNEPEGTLEKLIETNLYSAYHLTRALVSSMVQKQSGHIFNISSVAGIQSYPNGGSYSISKFAMQGLSKALREELKTEGIKVTSVIAGATLTDSWAGTDLPSSRFMTPQDIAQSIWDVYSLSPNTVVEELVLRPQLGDI